ncbi:hypothetical protein HW132_16155 [Brasilonema sp. CT11]|nr:hypothetical protein [Brasilonema sp. CT11]
MIKPPNASPALGDKLASSEEVSTVVLWTFVHKISEIQHRLPIKWHR